MKLSPVMNPTKIKVFDRESALIYLLALAYSEFEYHLDDDPADIAWRTPGITGEQIRILRENTANAGEILGALAWNVYYAAAVSRGDCPLSEDYHRC